MTHLPLTVLEHQKVAVGGNQADSLSWSELEQISQLAAERPGFCKLGHRSIKFAQYAGLVRIGDRLLEILPKVENSRDDVTSSRNVLLCLLSLAKDADIYVGDSVAQEAQSQTLLEVFIRAFLDTLSTLIRSGLLRRYLSLEDDLTVVRGRLRIGRQSTVHAMRFDRVACKFDELTADNEWNRVLRYALHVVRPWITKNELERRWFELSAAFSDVTLIHVTLPEIDTFYFDRHVSHYRPAIQWAKWIIGQLSPNVRAGNSKACEMLIDMNRLFESAVAASIEAKADGRTCSVLRQDSTVFLATLSNKNGSVKQVNNLRPDIVIREDNAVIGIADTKWTRVNADAHGHLIPDSAHMYQMLAYASAYRCNNLALIYPWHEGIAHAKPTTYALPQIGAHQPRVHLLCVNTSEKRDLVWSAGSSGFLTIFS